MSIEEIMNSLRDELRLIQKIENLGLKVCVRENYDTNRKDIPRLNFIGKNSEGKELRITLEQFGDRYHIVANTLPNNPDFHYHSSSPVERDRVIELLREYLNR